MKIDTLLPIFAPAPAGLVIAIRLNQEILVAVGIVTPAWQLIAGTVALIGCVGMIGAEMFAYKQAGLAIAERQAWAAIGAFVAALMCSGLVIWAIGTSENTRPLISSVVIAIMAYIILALRDFRNRKREIRQDSYDRVDKQKQDEITLEKLRNNRANAAVRLAKAGQPAPVQAVRVNSNVNSAFTPQKIAEIREYQANNPTAGVRQVAAACGVSVGSVAKYGVKHDQ